MKIFLLLLILSVSIYAGPLAEINPDGTLGQWSPDTATLTTSGGTIVSLTADQLALIKANAPNVLFTNGNWRAFNQAESDTAAATRKVSNLSEALQDTAFAIQWTIWVKTNTVNATPNNYKAAAVAIWKATR